jgi:hypothetical protein
MVPPPIAAVPSFEIDTEQVLMDVRDSLAAIFEQFDPPVLTPTDLRKRLGLDTKLSWSIFNAAHADSPHELAPLLPGWKAMGRFLTAAQDRGVVAQAIEQARQALERFEHTVRKHAADRDMFDAMVSAVSPERDDLIDERMRKRLFTDYSILWGLRAKAVFLCFVDHPTKEPGTLDEAMIVGDVELQQLRENQALRLETFLVAGDAAGRRLDKLALPQNPGIRSAMTLLPEFSTITSAHVAKEKVGLLGERTVIRCPALGRAAAIDLAFVQTVRGTAASKSYTLSSFAMMTCPAEVLYLDYLVPTGQSDPQTVRARVFANRQDMARAYDRDPEDLLPMRVHAVHRGRLVPGATRPQPRGNGRSLLAMAESRRYPELVSRVLADLAWNDCEYDVYRCQVRYPVLHAMVEVLVDRAVQ